MNGTQGVPEIRLHDNAWLGTQSSAFRLMLATSWLAPSCWQERQEKAIRQACAEGID